MKIAIIGGGMAGLGAAYEMAGSGHEIMIFEKEGSLGGLASSLSVHGHPIEQYYHHMFPSYADFFEVAEKLGMREDFIFSKALNGMWCDGAMHPFSTPFDLLRFKPLALHERLRAAVCLVYLKTIRRWEPLENIPATKWLVRAFGQHSYDVLWRPLLESKFSQASDQVSMAWFWGRIYERPSSFGYIKGGFKSFVDKLALYLKERGVRIHVNCAVSDLSNVGGTFTFNGPEGLETVDRVVIATPPEPMLHISGSVLPSKYIEYLKTFRYMGSHCMLLVLKQSLVPVYWLNVNDLGSPFVAVVEHTNFMPTSWYGGRHIVYLSKYLDPKSDEYNQSDEDIWKRWLPMVKRLNPSFDESWIEELHLFRAPNTQPVVPLGYSGMRPEYKTPVPGLWWVSMSHVYPWDRGSDHSFRHGRELARELLAI